MKTKVKCMICGEYLLKSLKDGQVFCNNKNCKTYIDDVGETYFAPNKGI